MTKAFSKIASENIKPNLWNIKSYNQTKPNAVKQHNEKIT